jgi:hypothetical protein
MVKRNELIPTTINKDSFSTRHFSESWHDDFYELLFMVLGIR